MPEPILAAQNTWFAPTVSSVTRASITEIEIMDSYTPTGTVTDSWDASAAKDGSVTCYVIGSKLIIAGNGSGKVYLNEDSYHSFGYYSTENAFANVTTFTNATLLDPSKCIRIWRLFGNMCNLTSLDLSGWNIVNVTSMSQVFFNCYALTTLNVSEWNLPSSAASATNLFSHCRELKYINLSDWDMSSITDAHGIFDGCLNLQQIEYPRSPMKAKSLNWAFRNCQKLTTIDLSKISDTSYTTSFQEMCSMCGELKTIVLPQNIIFTTAYATFQECKNLTNLDVSTWNMSSCTDMSFMFYGCSSLKEIDVSNWDTSKVNTLDHFAAHANLKRKGMEKWNTSSLVNANAAFHNCAEEELDLSGWDVSKVQFFCQMFENSPNLKRIKGLDKWNTSAGLGFDGMFERCSKLEEVDLSSFNTTKAKNGVSASSNGHKTATLNNMFLTCNNLEKVTVGANFSVNGDGTNTTAANKAILPTPSATYIPGADGNWYTFNGDQYAPNAMKDRTAATYYASFDMVADADVIVKNGSLIDTAKAIREKNGMNTQYTPSEFGAAIRAL